MTKIKHLRVRNRVAKRDIFGQKKSIAFILFIVPSLLALFASYIVFENSTVVVDRVSVAIPSLPRELENFTVLLITDLHGKRFEDKQSGVISALGSSRFDAVLFGGDIINDRTGSGEAFYELIDALTPFGKPLYYVPGNHDPQNYVLEDGICAYNPFLQGAVDRGVVPLESPLQLKTSENGSIWLWPLDQLSTDVDSAILTIEDNISLYDGIDMSSEVAAELAYNNILLKNCLALREARETVSEEDIHISLSHFPVTPAQLDALRDVEQTKGPSIMDADLLLAGHYHAGQWRIPGYGAVFVPGSDLPRGGWFPKQDEIAGLTQLDTLTQYISRGIGSTGPAAVRYRIFNPPEMALIQLTSRHE